MDFKSAFGIRFAKVALRGSLEMIWGGASFCGSILIAFSSAFSSEAPVRSYCQRYPPEEYNKLLSAVPARRGQQAAISGTRPQRTTSCYQRHPPAEYNKLLSAAPARRGQQAVNSACEKLAVSSIKINMLSVLSLSGLGRLVALK